MADTTFVSQVTRITTAWLQDINDAVYRTLLIASGAVSRTLSSKLDDFASPRDFGAIGNGVADDTVALENAILSGRALDFGKYSYKITREIAVTAPSAINWRSSGASIVAAPSSAIRSMLRLSVGPYVHRIDGALMLDAALLAYTGLRLENSTGSTFPSDYADIAFDGLHIKNVYRSGTAFSGGAGFRLVGAWRTVKLINPIIENMRLATGAGTPGIDGIAALSFAENGSGPPINISVINPYIASVLSEDGTYLYDQDGIVVIVTPSDSAPFETNLNVQGGTIRNCFGRGIKSQCEQTLIEGTKFIRTQGLTRGYGNEEVDFQEGGGSLLNCSAIYNGSAPDQVVRFSGSTQQVDSFTGDGVQVDFVLSVTPSSASAMVVKAAGVLQTASTDFTVVGNTLTFTAAPSAASAITASIPKASLPFGSIDGLKISIFGSTTLHEVWTNSPRETKKQALRVSNVEVTGNGTLENVCNFNGANGGSQFYLMMDNIVASPTGVFVNAATTASTATGEIKATRCINLGGSVINFRQSTSGNFRPTLSVSESVGFNDEDRTDNTATPMGIYQRFAPFTGKGASGGGLHRVDSFTLADGATYDFPDSGASNSTCGLFIAVGSSNLSSGMFAASDSGVIALTPEATAFTVGTTSDPGSGSYRLWATGSGVRLSNNSGAFRSVTTWMMG